jgi:hypothetical protein
MNRKKCVAVVGPAHCWQFYRNSIKNPTVSNRDGVQTDDAIYVYCHKDTCLVARGVDEVVLLKGFWAVKGFEELLEQLKLHMGAA